MEIFRALRVIFLAIAGFGTIFFFKFRVGDGGFGDLIAFVYFALPAAGSLLLVLALGVIIRVRSRKAAVIGTEQKKGHWTPIGLFMGFLVGLFILPYILPYISPFEGGLFSSYILLPVLGAVVGSLVGARIDKSRSN